MRIRLTMPAKDGKRLKDKVMEKIEKVEDDEWSEEWELVRSSNFRLSACCVLTCFYADGAC